MEEQEHNLPATNFADNPQYQQFLSVYKNRDACLTFLVRFTQTIEREWDQPNFDRVAKLLLLAKFLESLTTHKNNDLREISRLHTKIKAENIPKLSLKHFLGLFLPIERKYTRGLCDHEFLINREDHPDHTQLQAQSTLQSSQISLHSEKNQQTNNTQSKIPLIVILDNMRSAFNVGAIFRTAECFGVSQLILCGYTATPDEEKTLKTTMRSHQYVQWQWKQHTHQVIDELNSRSPPVPVIALETVADQPDIYSFRFPRKSEGGFALLLGNERFGIEADLLAKCKAIVRIPCVGVKNSLNVGVAFGIVAYEISRQWHLEDVGTSTE